MCINKKINLKWQWIIYFSALIPDLFFYSNICSYWLYYKNSFRKVNCEVRVLYTLKWIRTINIGYIWKKNYLNYTIWYNSNCSNKFRHRKFDRMQATRSLKVIFTISVRWIDRSGLIVWPQRSPHLLCLNIFLWRSYEKPNLRESH